MESVASINRQLIDLFGIDTITGDPMYRVTWADTQTEKRLVQHTDAGIQLLRPEVREVRKYPHIRGRYVLENLVLVPVMNMPELPASKLSYEPLFVFENQKEGPLPPRVDVCKFVIDTVNVAKGNAGGLAKYKDDPEGDFQKDINRTYQEFFGDETDVGDALRYKEGVVVPSKFFGE